MFLSAALALGCGGEAGTIVLTVNGDLEPGRDLDGLQVELWHGGAQMWSGSYELSAGSPFPASYRIEHPSGSAGAVEIAVEGTLDGRQRVGARRQASFVSGRQVEVEVCLWRRCGDAPELPGCTEGLCEGGGGGDGDADGDAEVDAEVDADGAESLCSNSCPRARDDRCDDGGEGSGNDLCDYGTDCADCGPRIAAECQPRSCTGRECGSDGCGGTCGGGCSAGRTCMLGGQCVEWVEVPAATFEMGAPLDELGRDDDEVPHSVVLSYAFLLAAREVSRPWFASVMGGDPSLGLFCTGDCPVDCVSWHWAAQFCNELSAANGLEHCYECEGSLGSGTCELSASVESPYECTGYRLPTESEWEHAARAGTVTATYNGDLDPSVLECEIPNRVLEPIAWYCGNSTRGHLRGTREPNAFGLYDMLGNVYEWVHDWYGSYPTGEVRDPWGPYIGTERILRGGAYNAYAEATRSAERFEVDPTISAMNVAFRPALTLH